MVEVTLQENWQDGNFLRTRSDRIRCEIKNVRLAMIETVNRLCSAIT